ncbi:nuclear transport factor 2 family protein [Spongiactinospora sp. TRM90649]|uniref:YybH family protein n=1 Tax=Spongiactinospora sp. TRM90649 TaxID=3031114 RepID=UPI0023F8D069|nr:nuclear transport factor 2 family protein [Spongiactinospora sp. TRM90649]MDF5755667.1 nuclear transport factor 2 family protein [Spongiactinospora sp. TRM90649]
MGTTEETRIKEMIEEWARAVHAGDLDAVLADHADDIVMFDVPPPHDGVRGLGEYRRTWPPFFEWQASGAVFEITSLEVTAGADVAFAHALLRCGTPAELARHPERRLRLTIGLRRDGDRWVVAHEHHSFAHTGDQDDAESEHEIRAIHQDWFEGTSARDLDGIMAHIAGDVVSYEHETPLRYTGAADVREVCDAGLRAATGPVGWDVPDLRILVRGDLAVAWGLNRMTAGRPGGEIGESWSRGTRVFRRSADGWSMVHQHVSYPYDPTTGLARTDLTP